MVTQSLNHIMSYQIFYFVHENMHIFLRRKNVQQFKISSINDAEAVIYRFDLYGKKKKKKGFV